ncbi:MAG: Na/Pi cotransporter family protein [Bacilli bacterium]|jgi:phosphate:Na+ symporter|nr:Na/Pi cotransporter family protein [Bacilli bacterium]MDD3389622.1 Na/Pi cotransporter family protein [Bacilli bacterium]MDD4345255.1 Na/Pi cotransporter family protein [Bacilli bacterium]MDD4521202.1 Na/Pi cotransporter family protein [Bacilli bacterium]MDY0399426.1 Na/Pi cotransporter family protein [Bacilli bacterium]
MIEAIVYLLAGLGAFLVGFKILSDNVQKLANQKLKLLFNKVTNNKLVGVGIGAIITMIVQSSSVTTIMVVGFVNAGLLNLVQATAIIMGANIGTTITAQLVALKAFDVTFYAMILAVIGIFGEMFVKNDKAKTIFYLLAGLGLIFIGLDVMASSMSIFKTSPAITAALTSINNPFLLLLIGIILTGIIQSSSAVTTILISMVAAGLTIGSGGNSILFVVLGTNIGTCVSALLSAIGVTSNGKRTALIHLMFNVFGTILIFPFLFFWSGFMDDVLAKMFPLPGMQIAMFHTFFNVVCTLVFLPMSPLFVNLSKKIIREKISVKPASFFDERLLKSPAVALGQLTKETTRMGNLAMQSLKDAIEAFIIQDAIAIERIKHKNSEIEQLEKEITEYLIKVSIDDLGVEEETMVSRLYHALGDFIRIAEISDNVLKYTRTSIDKHLEFSEAVRMDLRVMFGLLEKEFALTSDLFINHRFELLKEIDIIEEQVDNKRNLMIEEHLARLNQGKCSPNNSAVYINFVSNLERVGDHINFVAHSYEKESGEVSIFHD